MAKYVRLFQDCLGLNNAVSPTKGKFNTDTGAGELSVAVNVNILDDGAIERRNGITATAETGNVESIWTGSNGTFIVKNNYICKLNNDFTSTPIVAVTSHEVSYCDVQDATYFCNGTEKGIIKGTTVIPWTFDMATQYAGPSTVKTFSSPPVAKHVDLYNGRMYLAVDSLLFFSEPFGYSMYDYARGYFWFENTITGVKSITDGIYVYTTNAVYFLNGTNPNDMQLIKVSDYPLIPGTLVRVTSDNINIQISTYSELHNNIVIWTAQNGIYVASNNGYIKNVTDGRLWLPPVTSGCAVYHNRRYIVFLNK
jgi:hypothetical protein